MNTLPLPPMPTKQTKGELLFIGLMSGGYLMATKRGYYRGELIRALVEFSNAYNHLTRVRDAYAPLHPDIAQAIQVVMDGIEQQIELIQKLHDSI